MSRWHLFAQRGQLLDDLRRAEDDSRGDSFKARERLTENASALGIAGLPAWTLLLADGGIRGLRTYQELCRWKLGNWRWIIWRLLAAITVSCAFLYWLLRLPDLLIGIAFGPWLALTCIVAGATYDGMRALVGSTTGAKLASAAVASLAALGPTFMLLLPLGNGRVALLGGVLLGLGALFEWIWQTASHGGNKGRRRTT